VTENTIVTNIYERDKDDSVNDRQGSEQHKPKDKPIERV
jgi:hypothetical protein